MSRFTVFLRFPLLMIGARFIVSVSLSIGVVKCEIKLNVIMVVNEVDCGIQRTKH